MDSTYYIEKAVKDMFFVSLFFALPAITSIIINDIFAENLKNYPSSLLDIMNYFYYIAQFGFSLSLIHNFYRYHKHHKKEQASPVRAQTKIPTQNKKEVLDKIANF